MSGYPYNNQPGINPAAPQPGYYPPPTGQPGYPAPSAPYGFNPYGIPGQMGPVPGQPPISAMSYPGLGTAPPNVVPTPAYGYPGYPNVTPQQPYGPAVEWIPSTPHAAHSLIDRAVVAGYEGHDGSPLWVIRARCEGDLIPGKLAIKHQAAYVPWGGQENSVHNIEVCCARPERIRWVESRDGIAPPNAIAAGNTAEGETLFIGRAREDGSLTPGKVHPSHRAMYMSYAGKEIPHKVYEVLCTV